MKEKLKIGVVGLGSIGKRHFDNFAHLGHEVVGYDPATHKREDWAPLLSCDGVVIASPTRMHASHIQGFHDLKIPILVEKPLVKTRSEWEKVPLDHVALVGYNLRFHSCVRKVRQWMAEGVIGQPLWARFTCAQHSDKEPYLRDGVILNWSHEIDLAIHLLGKAFLRTASALRRTKYGEDLADLILAHTNGCQSVVHLDYIARPERRGFCIIGANGSIDADLVTRQAFCKDNDGKIIHTHFGVDCFDSNYVTEANAFIALVTKKVKPENLVGCTAAQAHFVADICLDAQEYINAV